MLLYFIMSSKLHHFCNKYCKEGQTIKSCYRKNALKYHPDKNSSKEAEIIMRDLNNKYDELKGDYNDQICSTNRTAAAAPSKTPAFKSHRSRRQKTQKQTPPKQKTPKTKTPSPEFARRPAANPNAPGYASRMPRHVPSSKPYAEARASSPPTRRSDPYAFNRGRTRNPEKPKSSFWTNFANREDEEVNRRAQQMREEHEQQANQFRRSVPHTHTNFNTGYIPKPEYTPPNRFVDPTYRAFWQQQSEIKARQAELEREREKREHEAEQRRRNSRTRKNRSRSPVGFNPHRRKSGGKKTHTKKQRRNHKK